MKRIDRLTAILSQLQSKRLIKAREIAGRFQISLRTVYRDIKALEKAGIPILGEAGQGYSLVEGYRLPPVMFTQEEGVALVLAEKMVRNLTDQGSSHHLQSAMIKIKAVVKNQQKDLLENLGHQIQVIPQGKPLNPVHHPNYLNLLLQALVDKLTVNLVYTTFEVEKASKRTVEPVGIFYAFQQWYLIAWCQLRNDYRTFRLDRVNEMKLGDESYNPSSHPTLANYLAQVKQKDHLIEFVLHVPLENEKYLKTHKYTMGLVQEIQWGNYYEMRFMNSSIEGFIRWLLPVGDKIQLIEPKEAKDFMKNLVETIQLRLNPA